MLSLATRFWGVTASEAISRLLTGNQIETLPPNDLSNYEALQLRYTNIANFWQKSQRTLLKHEDLCQLRMILDSEDCYDTEGWRQRGGRFMGAASRNDFRDMFNFSSHAKVWQHTFSSESLQKLKPTDNCLVVPFCDLPGRISSLMFSYVDDNKVTPVAFVSTLVASKPGKPSPLTGVAMLEALLRKSSYGDYGLVMNDPLLAAKIHLRHFRVSDEMLPLAAIWTDTPTSDILKHTASHRIVFWAERPDADFFRHAIAANGYVSMKPVEINNMNRYVTKRPAAEWLHIQVRDSVPWQEALEQRITDLPVNEAESLLTRLQLSSGDLNKFVEQCSSSTKARLSKFADNTLRLYSHADEHNEYYETEDGWFSIVTNEMISDTIIRIEYIIDHLPVDLPNAPGDHYLGYLIHKGERIPFLVRVDDLFYAIGVWLTRELINAGHSAPHIAFTRRSLFNIACSFHQPKRARAVDGYGWDETSASFVFPNYAIRMDGTWGKPEIPVLDTVYRPVESPDPPRDLTDQELSALNSKDARIVWGTFLATAHNLMAGTFQYEQIGTVVHDHGAFAVKQAAAKMGCPSVHYRPSNSIKKVSAVSALERHERRTGWPTFVENQASLYKHRQTWIKETPHNCFMVFNWYMTRVCALSGNWSIIDGRAAALPVEIQEATRAMLPAFLVWMTKQKLMRTRPKVPSLVFAEELITRWYKEAGGDAASVREGCRSLVHTFNHRISDNFLEILFRLCDENRLLIQRPSRPVLPHVVAHDKKHQLWVSKLGFNRALQEAGAAPLDFEDVTVGLQESGMLVGEKIRGNYLGWMLHEDWLLLMTRWRNRNYNGVQLFG